MAAIRDYKSEPSLQDNVNKSLKKISDKVSANADEFAGALIRKNAADIVANIEANGTENLKPVNAAIAAENDKVLAENQAKQNANVEKANARNAQLATDAAALGARHQASIDRIAANGQAAFDAGAIRGEYRANSLRTVSEQAAAMEQFKQQADSFVKFREGQRAAAKERLGLSVNAATGSYGDAALWYGASILEGAYQGAQFLGKAFINGATLGTMNDTFSPFRNYDSLIGEGNLFGSPTTVWGALGRDSGEVGSYFIDPLGAVGSLGKLSKFNVSLSLKGTPVQRFSGNNGSYLVEEEFVFGKASQFNLELKAIGREPAYMPNTVAWETTASNNIPVNMAVAPDQILKDWAGTWSTPASIDSISFARNELAITPNFKKVIAGVRSHTITEGAPYRIGVVGSQFEGGVLYKGGAIQFQHMWNIQDDVLTSQYLPISEPAKRFTN